MKRDRLKQLITIYSFIFCLVGIIAVLVVFPKETVSRSERRRLTPKPALTVQNLLDESFMEDFEEYLLDHFPFREGLRRVKAYFAYNVLRQKENNGIYVAKGHASKLEYPLNKSSVKRLAGKMKGLKEQYFPEQNTWYAVVPDKNYFLAEQNGYPAMDYEAMLRILREELGSADEDGGFRYIDIPVGLSIEDYYHTDTHWRQERLAATVSGIAKALQVDTYLHLDPAQYGSHEIRDFYGVYYGQAALPMDPDTITYLTNDAANAARVWNIEENMAEDGSVAMPEESGAVWKPVYQPEKLEDEFSFDKYDVFLGGAASLQVIQSPKANPAGADRRLIIFRDSYTSSLAPLLLEAYGEIVLIDLRYIHSGFVGEYVDFTGADVLFVYNTSIINNSSMLK